MVMGRSILYRFCRLYSYRAYTFPFDEGLTMYWIILKGSPEPIICATWHAVLLTLGEMQRIGVEVENYGKS